LRPHCWTTEGKDRCDTLLASLHTTGTLAWALCHAGTAGGVAVFRFTMSASTKSHNINSSPKKQKTHPPASGDGFQNFGLAKP
jgi:hypothetical protein